ncbi:MAG: DUF2071 domain-containing protein [Chthoniobacterales bacterium]
MSSFSSRLRLREEPDTPPVMRQQWEHLLFLHWRLPEDVVQRSLPPGLFVDTHEGTAWIGVVPFAMRKVRPVGLPWVPGISNFLELNIRTYVHDGKGNYGVWFYSLEANQPLAVWAARKLFHLNYVKSKMRMRISEEGIRYSSCRGDESQEFHYRGTGSEWQAEVGTLDFFLIERYLLFSYNPTTKQFYYGRVHHAPYEISPAAVETWSTWGIGAAGLPRPESAPDSAYYTRCLKVNIYGLTTTEPFQTFT